MYILFGIICILCIIFLFLYLQLRNEIKQFYKQLRYMYEEDSQFVLFTSSSNRVMQGIVKEVNVLKESKQQEKDSYVKNEHSIRDMITNISHDIRTPLTSIQGYMEMMRNEDEQTKDRYYGIITNRLYDLESMLDEFFLYTKIMSNTTPLEMTEIEVYPFVCKTLLNYMDVLNLHHLQPSIQCDNEALCVYAHEESLRRICTNLIMNTIRYGQAPYNISIQDTGDMINMQFQNQVEDASQVQVDQMFERFYKGDMARTKKGSGLGLAIVQELVLRMNGTVCAKCIDSTLTIEVVLNKAQRV